jgi:hypothetical protein
MRARLTLLLAVGFAAPALAQSVPGPVALENDYVLVSRNSAPCAAAAPARCEDRVILAMGDLTLRSGGADRAMKRGEVAVFKAGESYEARSGTYFEVSIKPNHPPVKSPPELIPPPNNMMMFKSEKFFIYDEKLEPATPGRGTATANVSRSGSTTGRCCISGSIATATSPRRSPRSSTGASR